MQIKVTERVIMNRRMDWRSLYFGKLDRKEIQIAVADYDWQETRLSMKGTSLQHKYNTLCEWLHINSCDRTSQVQVTNYVTALSRGGLIKSEDYNG